MDVLEPSESAWDKACARDDVIRALTDGIAATDAKIGRARISQAAAQLSISPATLYRLIKKFRADRRVTALLPGKRGRPIGTRRISEKVEAIISDRIDQFYLQPERPTFQQLCREIRRACAAAGELSPALTTVKRRVDEIDEKRRARRRGDDAALEAMTATPGYLETFQPLDFVQIDHTLADIVVVDEDTRQFIGRPWLTLGIDVHTRMVTGFSLSFDPPQSASVSLCLLHSVFDKTAWLQSLGIDISWPVAGLPKRIGVDNAKEFRSPTFVTAARDFGIEVEFRPPGKKHYGGHIERLIGTQMGAIQLLPGTTHGGIKAKQSYDPQASAVLTLRELESWVALEIVGHYHQRIHSALMRPPIAVWRECEERINLTLPEDRLAFWVSFLPGETRVLQRDGIHLFNICYWSNALRGDVGRTKESLVIKYDPRNIAKIFVKRPNGNWVEARYRNLNRPSVALWEHQSALRKLRRQGRKEMNEHIIFATITQQREIVAKAQSHSAAARLAKVRTPATRLSVGQEIKVKLTGINLAQPAQGMEEEP